MCGIAPMIAKQGMAVKDEGALPRKGGPEEPVDIPALSAFKVAGRGGREGLQNSGKESRNPVPETKYMRDHVVQIVEPSLS